jgi:DNA-binding response OmpR family regulator
MHMYTSVGVEELGGGESERTRDPSRRGLVLVIEDNPHDWEIYGKILWYNGFDVIYAPDGATGYDMVTSQRPDLVLLDLGLPDMDGLELCARLKKTGDGDLPIMILSGRPARELGSAALAAGCVRYMEKPALPVDVLHAVEDLIGRPPPAGVGPTPKKHPPTA